MTRVAAPGTQIGVAGAADPQISRGGCGAGCGHRQHSIAMSYLTSCKGQQKFPPLLRRYIILLHMNHLLQMWYDALISDLGRISTEMVSKMILKPFRDKLSCANTLLASHGG
ncbi:unnamed protein product [Urochloa humidicola]